MTKADVYVNRPVHATCDEGFLLTRFAVAILLFGCLTPSVRAAEPCAYLTLLVSGFNSNSLHSYHGCTGEYLGDLDTGTDLQGAQGVVRGPDGNLYVASEKNDRILRFDWETGVFIDTFVWDDPATSGVDESGGLAGPTGVAFGPDDNLYVGSFDGDQVLKYDGDTGAFLGVFVAANEGGLDGPDAGMVFGPDGNLYVPSFNSDAVIMYNGTSGAHLGAFADGSSGLSAPRTVLFREDNNHVLVTSWRNDRILEYDSAGNLIGTFATRTRPTGMAFGPDGNLYVTSDSVDRVWRLNGVDGSGLGLFVPSGSGGLDGATFVFFWGDVISDVPAVSEWGIVVLTLTLICAGTVVLSRSRRLGACSP